MARRPTALALVLVVAVVVLAALAVDAFGGPVGPTVRPSGSSGAATATATGSVVARTSASVPAPAIDPASGLATIDRSSLPKAALLTLDLIATGGPYPYPQDGTTYRNLERMLPARATGYYREFTVATPGSSDRGARRIVAGGAGELYWTADHYASFRRIVP